MNPVPLLGAGFCGNALFDRDSRLHFCGGPLRLPGRRRGLIQPHTQSIANAGRQCVHQKRGGRIQRDRVAVQSLIPVKPLVAPRAQGDFRAVGLLET